MKPDGLSDSQIQAVRHGYGPAMVLAGPGSGKTMVITHRVWYLMNELHIPAENILVITFTRAAAAHMRQRFVRLSGTDKTLAVFGTFHAVFFQILKQAYHFTSADILREDEKYRILGELAVKNGIGEEESREIAAGLAAEISVVKNEQIGLSNYYAGICADEVFRKIASEYDTVLRGMRKIDFDDMLTYTKELFAERKDILSLWQNRFRFILIDEFQDINSLQYEVVRMLASGSANLFAVGDDDQSIYRFRGARPEIMLRFPDDYAEAVLYRLQENYRSRKEIVDASSKVISQNTKRYAKECLAVRGKGRPVVFHSFASLPQEAAYIIDTIQRLKQADGNYSDMAILTRTNTGGRYISEKLIEAGIPFMIRDAIPCLYDHWIARDILSYIRLGLGSRMRSDFLQIMNRPVRYISRDALEDSEVSLQRLRAKYANQGWMIERLEKLEEDLSLLSHMKPYAAVNYIRRGIGYDRFLDEYAQSHHTDRQQLMDIAEELQEQAGSYDTYKDWSEHIDAYRQTILRQQRQAAREGAGSEIPDAVVISTLHSAKGLEFNTVFLPDVNEDTLPFHKASRESDIEEERRLFYVGMTRAADRLYILWTHEKFGKKQLPSRFLECFSEEK